MANRRIASMIGLTNRGALKRVAALLAFVMTADVATVPLAQAAMLAHPAPINAAPGFAAPVLPVGRASQPNFVAPFRLPSSIGATVEVHSPVSAGRIVYHLQDVHGNVAAQTNLSEIVRRLAAYAQAQGKTLVVAVEGGVGPLESDDLSAMPDDKMKDDVTAGLIRSGFLMGEERAAIMSKPGVIKIVGVESAPLYNRNVLARERSKESRERVLTMIRGIKTQLTTLEQHNFSPLLLQLEKNRVAVEEGRMEMGDYLIFLSHTSPALVKKSPTVSRMLSVAEQEKTIDFPAVEKEGRQLVEELVRKKDDKDVERIMKEAVALREGRMSPLAYYRSLLSQSDKIYPDLERYTAYLRDAEQVNPDALFGELETLENQIAQDLVRHPLAYELYRNIRWIERQERFFSLNMVPQEWQAQKGVTVAEISRTHEEIRAFVDEQVAALGYRFATPTVSMADLKAAFRGADDFYRDAEARNGAMFAHLLKTLDKYDNDHTLVAFIAGGFHTPGLTREFREHGLAYEVIRPQIEAGVQLSTDLVYPPYAPQPRLLSDRSQTDFLRGATVALTPEGNGYMKSQIRSPSTTSPYPAADPQTPFFSPQTIAGAWRGAAGVNREKRLNMEVGALGLYALAITLVVGIVLFIVWFIKPAIRALRAERPTLPDLHHSSGIDLAHPADNGIDLTTLDQRSEAAVPATKAKPFEDEIIAMVRRSAEVFGFSTDADLSDILYIAVQYSQYLVDDKALVMITDADGNVNPAVLSEGNKEGANFQPSALEPSQTFPLLGVIDLEKDVKKRAADAPPVKARVVVDSLDGGVGENYTRVEYLKRRRLDVLGAKGTDLAHTVTVVRVKHDGTTETTTHEVSVAEMKLLQLLRKRASFEGMAFEPLVNTESRSSYERLLDQPYLGDVLDDRVAVKRTYREVLTEKGIELPGLHLQRDLFGVKADDLTLPTQKEGVPAQPGGHAQLGFWFFIEALKDAQQALVSGVKKLVPTVRVFYNGDNLNSRPNDSIVEHMIENNHVAYMVATPAEAIDKKGGKIGVRWYNVRGKWIPVPDMMEIAQAKAVKQVEQFYEAGQPGGIGVPGRQLFNTNQLYINEDLLGQILLDLKNLLRTRLGTNDELRLDFELAKIFGPTLIRKDAKNGYFPIDGAIGSVLLNLNAYFLLNGDDEDVANILKKRGIDQILHIINGPRMEAFTPEKSPADRINEDGRFTIDSANEKFEDNEWTFQDTNPGAPMPDIDVRSTVNGPITANWKKDAGDWADLGHIQALLPGLNTSRASYIGFHGLPVRLPAGTRFIGRVKISNHMTAGADGARFTDLRAYRAQLEGANPAHVTVTASGSAGDNFSYVFTDAHVVIHADGRLEVLPFGQEPVQQNFSPVVPVLGGLALIAIGAFVGIDHSLWYSLIAIVGLIPAAIGVLATVVKGPASSQTDDQIDIHALLDNPDYDQARVRKVIEFAKIARPDNATEPVRVVAQSGIVANVKGGVLNVGRGLLKSSVAAALNAGRTPSTIEHLIDFVRDIVLHIALYHEIHHTRAGRSELLAYPLGVVAAILPFLFGNATPLPRDTTYSERGIMYLTQRYGMNGRLFYDGMVALFGRLRSRLTSANVPAYIGIDTDSMKQLGDTPEDGRDISESDEGLVDLITELHIPAAGADKANAVVVFYTQNVDIDRLGRLQTMVTRLNRAKTGIRFRLVSLPAAPTSAAALFGPSAKNTNEDNTVILTTDDTKLAGATMKKVMGVPHLALATFAYSHYGAKANDALTELMNLINLLVKDFTTQPTLTIEVTDEIMAAMQA